ncbi:Ig-like domain-containing protein [Segetibacter koreensis]|uniref:Ig-like domain-containing protein n=1 Tax=Segetibacter koreensis TaxID=398037 RepID=UPI00037E1C77|nr:Ig-like domain-containing protein [Segetibacter koreensis]
MKHFFTLLFVLFLYSAEATTYYFSASSGDDSRTPTQAQSSSTPWKSLNKLNSFFSNLQPGDAVLFKRGETFYGSIIVNKSGTSGSPILIGAYGTGDKPVITSLVTLSGWTANSTYKGVYDCSANSSLGSRVNMVLLNDVEQGMGRYPNSNAANKGYLTLESHSGKTSITDNELTSSPNWTGAELVIRSFHWIMDRYLITSHSGSTLYFSALSEPKNDYGYFIQNSIKTLDQLGEWYYNPTTKRISMYFGTNTPSSYTVKATAINNLVYADSKNYLVFDNLTLKGANENCVDINNGSHISITNCNISSSGIDGVNLSLHSYFKLENCSVLNSFNNGVSASGSNKYAIIRNNFVRNTYYIAGMGQSGQGVGAGIRISNSGLVEYNRIINSGAYGITMGGDYTTVKNNYIDTFNFIKDDCGGIYTSGNFTTYGRKITGNIVLNGIGAQQGTDAYFSSADGIYMDGGVNGVEITGNTIANSNRGIFLNSTHDIVLRNNTSFNNINGQLHMKYDGSRNPLYNHTINNNIFFSKNAKDVVSAILTRGGNSEIAAIGTFDSNYYARPIDDQMSISNTTFVYTSSQDVNLLTLQAWKGEFNKDIHSKGSPKQIASYNLKSLIGLNKFPSGGFNSSTDISKCYRHNSCTVSWANSSALDGGYLAVVPSAKTSSIVMGVGTLSAGKKYILKYSLKGTGNMSIGAFLRGSSSSNYAALTKTQYRAVGTGRTENDMIFTPSVNETSGALVLSVDAQSTYYIDNVQLFEADATITNPDDSIKFVFNASQVSKTFSLNGRYIDVKNNKFSNSIVLQPYQSAVLIKDGGVQNAAPIVSITSPLANATIDSSASVNISATATDSDGTVTKVEFYNGNTLLATDSTSPYNYTWNNVPAGIYTITAKATDNNGAVTTSSVVIVTVISPIVSLKPAENNDTTNAGNVRALNLNLSLASNNVSTALDAKVFPNPAVNKIQIKLEGLQVNYQKANLSVTNLAGIVVKNIPVVLSGVTLQMDVTSLSTGVYIAKITSDNFIISKKFIKN